MTKPRILVIDDETALLRSMKRVLSDRYTVTTASGGLEALEILAEDSDFDVIFCDLMMPEVDGPMLYNRVTAQDPSLVERFVFCTGGAFTVRAREFLDDLPCKCAQKPLRLAELHALVDSVLGRGRARDVG